MELLERNKILAEVCRRSFYEFVQIFWSTVITEEPVYNWHMRLICDELQRIGERVKRREAKEFDYFIINVPPGSSKSTLVSEMYPVWCWTIDASQRFICGSYSSTVSEDIADKCRKIFTSQLYRELFPEVGVRRDVKTHLENNQKGERYTTSTGSGITGIHAHQILIDDPLNPQQASSDVERETANKWISETLSTRQVNKEVSVTIIVMQRLHENDPTGYLMNKKGVRVKQICLPAEVSSNVYPEELADFYADGLLDPQRMSRPVLAVMRDQLGSYGYAGQFDQVPADLAGGIIKRSWFDIIDGTHFGKVVRFVLDTAYTVKKENDPSGLLAYFMDGNNLVISNFESVRLEFPELVKYTASFVKNNGYSENSSIRVEPKASGKSLVQQSRQETKLNFSEDVNPEKDKVTRATSITAKLEGRRVKLLRGAWNERFLAEVCMFPRAKHDEAVDLLVMAVRRELVPNRAQNLQKYF